MPKQSTVGTCCATKLSSEHIPSKGPYPGQKVVVVIRERKPKVLVIDDDAIVADTLP